MKKRARWFQMERGIYTSDGDVSRNNYYSGGFVIYHVSPSSTFWED
jgi:hypothetical protein